MKPIVWLFACVGVVAGCRDNTDRRDQTDRAAPATPAVPDVYRSDIENLCDAVVRSGADQRPAAEHPLLIAKWLGDHLQTEAAHQYLVQIQPLTGEPKAAALEAEARRVGLPGCALADQWRATP